MRYCTTRSLDTSHLDDISAISSFSTQSRPTAEENSLSCSVKRCIYACGFARLERRPSRIAPDSHGFEIPARIFLTATTFRILASTHKLKYVSVIFVATHNAYITSFAVSLDFLFFFSTGIATLALSAFLLRIPPLDLFKFRYT